MATARVFKSGNSQAVRLPKEFRVEAEELEIFRRGDELVLREPRSRPKTGAELFEALARLGDLIGDEPDDPPPEEREGL